MIRRAQFLPLLLIAVASCTAFADDWPGWMGASRDDIYRESGVIESIPKEGLKVKWRVPIEGGYAGPAVAGGKVFVFDYKREAGRVFNNPGERANLQGKERLTVLDEATGKQIWQHAYDCPYSISYPAGPRCTPTVDGDRVYTLGSEGDLKCLNVRDGNVVWSRSFKKDFSAEVPIWGFASHPLVDGDLLYTMVGGESQCVVAFDKLTGEVRWKALDANAGYCPPSLIEQSGKKQLIVYHPKGVQSLNPLDGSKYWNVDLEPSYDMSINRPVIDGDLMYASGIHTASVLSKLSEDGLSVSELWRGEPKNAVYTCNSTPFFTDGVIYGADCNLGSLIAVDANDGSRLWESFEPTRKGETRFVKHGTAFITRLGKSDRYLLMSEMGDLIIASLTRSGYQEHGRFHCLEPTSEAFGRDVVWSHPAYANRTAYIRNDKEIVAVDLSK